MMRHCEADGLYRHGEHLIETVHDHASPIKCSVPGCRATYYVTGITRRRNYRGGRVLTLAVGEWARDGYDTLHPIRDIATMMKLADLVSHHHMQPVNDRTYYGPNGRGVSVGRTETITAGTVDRVTSAEVV